MGLSDFKSLNIFVRSMGTPFKWLSGIPVEPAEGPRKTGLSRLKQVFF
jgi:hypothetical protein